MRIAIRRYFKNYSHHTGLCYGLSRGNQVRETSPAFASRPSPSLTFPRLLSPSPTVARLRASRNQEGVQSDKDGGRVALGDYGEAKV